MIDQHSNKNIMTIAPEKLKNIVYKEIFNHLHSHESNDQHKQMKAKLHLDDCYITTSRLSLKEIPSHPHDLFFGCSPSYL
ncbi:hypothetical protein Bca4012_049962 [Brassica carinata]